ncbi:helix-turn-helix domain-containing transcriptional regulator [Parvularcula lutaonensis]|uniref:DNA-binding protein n=1 Tax=Parvularcula lutaonensis TaxID=491923 RepID=A0ABV7MEP7_9PROT|nr:transcriptional regulator [Parvularcula lutaonensis]GGY57236.1 hypothetical protein GCM10007148_28380 [Parvularcula lutaonensis]
MALTRSFDDSIKERASKDPSFRRGLIQEGVMLFCDGQHIDAQLALRDYVNATLGFQKLSALTGIPAPSLMRMLSVKGNPSSENFSKIVKMLRAQEKGTGAELRKALA